MVISLLMGTGEIQKLIPEKRDMVALFYSRMGNYTPLSTHNINSNFTVSLAKR
jgi:hypothetical protein